MKLNELYDLLNKKATDKGFEKIELFYQESREFNSKVFRSEVEKYQIAEESGVSIRGQYKGKIGYFYSELADDSIVDEALESIIATSQLMDVEDEKIIGMEVVIEDFEDFDESLQKDDYKSIIDEMIKNEEKLKKYDERITDLPYNMYAEMENFTFIRNSNGVKLSQKTNLFYYVLSALAKDGDKAKTAMGILVDRNQEKFTGENLMKTIAKESVDLLSAQAVDTGVYNIILRNDAAAELMDAFSGIFSAEMVDKNMSVLKDKVDKKIGNSLLTILDNPFEKNAHMHRKFDDEGTLTKEKTLIDEGVLKKYLHNSKTSKKMDMDNTGNGVRSGIKSLLGISHTNLYIKPGSKSFKDMILNLEKGLLITNLQALHSGLNPISGDFSLPAQGYLIESGEIMTAVDNITIAGNVLDVFNDIEEIGNDLYFYLPNGMGSVGSPSVKVKNINVTGK